MSSGAAYAAEGAAPAGGAGAGAVEELQVTGHKLEDSLPEELGQTGVKVDVITDLAIRNGGYVDIAQSLQALAPGLYIQAKNGPFDYVDISLLGSRTQDVLWLVDGIRINNRLYAGTTPLDTLPSSMVSRIEVLEGGQALFYGTQAVAGAVNVVTRPFSTSPTGMATIGADTNGGRHLDTFFSNSIGRSQFVVYGSADTSSGYDAFRKQDYQPSATDRSRGYDVYTLGGKYAYNFTDQIQLSAAYKHTDAKLDYALPYRVSREVNTRREDLISLKLDYDVNDRLSFYVKGYYHNWHTTYDTEYNDLAKPGTIDVLYHDAFWGYKDYGVNVLGKLLLTKGVETYFGYDVQSYGGRDDVLVITQQDETTQAGFAQLRLTHDLIPNLNLAAGVRYSSPSVGRSATIWNVSGQYDLPWSMYIKGDVGTNFRLPTAEELFANDPQDERGNPNLQPESSSSLNASFGGVFDMASRPINWEVTGFARNIKNLITYATFDAATGQDVFGNVAGTVRVRGYETSVNAELSDAVSTKVSYTHNSSHPDGAPQLIKIPTALAKVFLDYHPPELPIGVTLSAIYTGDVYNTVSGKTLDYGNYGVFDLSGRYFFGKDRRQTLNLSVQNLFDREYGKPAKGCLDVPTDRPTACSSPYTYVNLGLPRTFRATYSYEF
ncbi:TonB-dependent receptor [Phenylobacterium sp.]|uniref:TonB-dependent receptor plug domain-containing protein n=1 Tax=Phenylobacterium sp. TaxID=1871053 RepID=UPI002E31D7AB|nr:TonB-dependent receptor [Phenylobacterium sp.]HEX4709263.1 TonB-dependent receptor [Phenylobacterium sp.]